MPTQKGQISIDSFDFQRDGYARARFNQTKFYIVKHEWAFKSMPNCDAQKWIERRKIIVTQWEYLSKVIIYLLYE